MREQAQSHHGTYALDYMAIRAGGARQINETTKHSTLKPSRNSRTPPTKLTGRCVHNNTPRAPTDGYPQYLNVVDTRAALITTEPEAPHNAYRGSDANPAHTRTTTPIQGFYHAESLTSAY